MDSYIDFEHDESDNHIAVKLPHQENPMIPVSVNRQLSPIPSSVLDEVIEQSSDSPITRPSRSTEETTQGSHLSNSQTADSPVKPTMLRSQTVGTPISSAKGSWTPEGLCGRLLRSGDCCVISVIYKPFSLCL